MITHAYITHCPHCGGIDAFAADDTSPETDQILADWVKTGRGISKVVLPVTLSCTCDTTPKPPREILIFE